MPLIDECTFTGIDGCYCCYHPNHTDRNPFWAIGETKEESYQNLLSRMLQAMIDYEVTFEEA